MKEYYLDSEWRGEEDKARGEGGAKVNSPRVYKPTKAHSDILLRSARAYKAGGALHHNLDCPNVSSEGRYGGRLGLDDGCPRRCTEGAH